MINRISHEEYLTLQHERIIVRNTLDLNFAFTLLHG